MIFALLPVPCLVVDLELGSLIRRSILFQSHVISMRYASIGLTNNDPLISILDECVY